MEVKVWESENGPYPNRMRLHREINLSRCPQQQARERQRVLTRRIIERICAPDGSGSLSRLLVVTFTKAAAAELISRISDALTEELAKNPGNRHLRAQSLLVSSAPISTIHSFCLELIRANFKNWDFPADFSTAEETEVDIMKKRIRRGFDF